MTTSPATAPSSREGMWRELLPPGRRYLALPTRRHPVVVAEDRAPVLSYVRQSLLAIPPPMPGWLYPAARAALAVPALPRILPGLAVTAEDAGAAPPDEALDDLGRLTATGPVVLLDHSHDPAARLLLLVFPPGSPDPATAVKIPTGPHAAQSILREAERLGALARLPLGAARPTVPTVQGLLRHGDLPALATTALPGVSMLVAYHRPGHHARPGPVRADFAAAAHWLADLQSATAGAPAPLDLRPGVVETLDGRLPRPARVHLHALRRRLRAHRAPRTAVHGDFWPGNLLVGHGRISGVVDWEHARSAGSPLADPARFIVSYCEYLDRRTRPGHRVPGHHGLIAGRPGAALVYALHGTGWYPRLVRDFLAAAVHRLGLPVACGRDAVLAELAAVAAEATDPRFAQAQDRAFTVLLAAEEVPWPS
ncbi:phosphotransferase family protein [Streptomyces sp. NPDC053367]|uniref:phosphotransferase family protein n=1 Tax=Streptomyces sp. NPDC053367 TaxID=3365700 RepID=UPI0037D0DE7C